MSIVIINSDISLTGWSGKKLTFLASLAGLVELPDQLTWRGMSWADRVVAMKTAQACLPVIESGDPIPDVSHVVTLGTTAWKVFNTGYGIKEGHGLPRLWINEEMNPVTLVPMFHPYAANRNSSWAHLLEHDWVYLGEILAGRGDEAKEEFLLKRADIHV